MSRWLISVLLFVLRLTLVGEDLSAAQAKSGPVAVNSVQTISFSPLAQPGGSAAMGISPSAFHGIGSSYIEDGFTFVASDSPWGPQTLGTWLDGSPNHPAGGRKATPLTAYYAGTRISATSTTGSFDLISIDLAQWAVKQGGGTGSFPVTFHGMRNGSEVVTQTFQVRRVPQSPVLSTYQFKGFTNLTSFYVIEEGTYATGYGFQLNNIVFRRAGPPIQSDCPRGPSVLLWTNSNTLVVQNGPGGRPAFGLSSPACVTQVVTYHWNNGRGATPGKISIQQAPSSGPVLGTFQAAGTSGQNNVPNANWVANIDPPLMLKPDNYSVIDSDDLTWSRNQRSNLRGFAEVYGICVEGTGSDCVAVDGSFTGSTLDLTGQWRCTTVPPCGTGIATIQQNGSDLNFVNERGSPSPGKLLFNKTNLIAYAWGQNGLHGVVGANAGSILWENHTRWERINGPQTTTTTPPPPPPPPPPPAPFTPCVRGSSAEALLGNKPCRGTPGTMIFIQAKENLQEGEALSGVAFKKGQSCRGGILNFPPDTAEVVVCSAGAPACPPTPSSSATNGLMLVSGNGVQQGSLYELATPPELCTGDGQDKGWDVYLLFPAAPARDIGCFTAQCK